MIIRLLALSVPFIAAQLTAAPVVSNLTASQRAGTKLVDIGYDLTATGFPTVAVSLQVSSDGGATWTVPVTSVSGAIGNSVAPGTQKVIVWNAGIDWPQSYSTQMRFRVVANDGFALIPGGSFTMGRTSGQTTSNAQPVNVSVQTFYLQKMETTKAQWDEVRDWALENGYSDLRIGAAKATNHPVGNVSWWDVIKWCNARSEMEGLTPCYTVGGNVMRTGITEPVCNWRANGYRLPTETEWEKAARGGISGKLFPWGTDTISHDQANFTNSGATSYAVGSLGTHPLFTDGTSPFTSPVGYFEANTFGLHDMSGNVMEWVWDWYDAAYYTTIEGSFDPRGPVSSPSEYRVRRGGHYNGDESFARCHARFYNGPGFWGISTGFRPARSHLIDDMSLIPEGSFTMGRTSGDTDSNAPPITVTVSPFYIQQTETTKAQWDEVRTWAVNNGYTDLAEGAGKASNPPVQTVSWWDVVKWCNARSEKEGLTPVYTVGGAVMRTGTTVPAVNWRANGYRLPTEAEWEKAARGGVSGKRFPWGTDTISHAQANYYGSSSYAYDQSPINNYHPSYKAGGTPYTSPVGSFGANGYGLYDMAGNVYEWCWDWYGSSYYTTSNGTTDPLGPASGSARVGRGGGWDDDAFLARCAFRGSTDPGYADDSVGFRSARSSVSDERGGSAETPDVTVDTRDAPTVTTPAATSITAADATLGGNVTADGGAAITERGVIYSATATNNNPIIGGAGVTKVTATGTTGVFTAPVTGLTQGTSYSFKAYAINSLGTSYTSAESFVTLTVLGIRGLDQPILSGSTAPSPSNGTDFGDVVIGQVASRFYTLENPGSEPLSMTGEPLVVVEGDHGNDFHVTVAPETVVQAGRTTAFEIRFAPTQPGIREATIKFAMSGITESPANFAVQGFGALPVPRRQTVAFSPPAVVYLSQSPLPLTATAPSGLPVTLQLISGPATLGQDGLLTLTTPGTVKVQASQAGDGTHAAAPTVQRTIKVKPDPSALTLVDLVKTYNGSPQAAGVVGVAPADVTLTYKVGGVFRAEPPTQAGQYPVKAVAGGVTKTGTLIIHPASLVVQVEDQRRLVGQPNPAFTVIFDGFIGGDTLETVLTTPIRLTTKATLRSPVGSYPILSSGGAVISNYKLVHRPGTLVVEGVAGGYEALLKNPDSGLPNGHLALTVPGASTSLTASLRLGIETSAISWSGPLTLSESNRLATATLVKTVSGVNYDLKVALSMVGEMSCEVRRAGVLVAVADDGIRMLSLPKGQTSAAEGRYTVLLEPAQPAGDTVPTGAGWATGRADSKGKITLSGRLADGTAFTAGLPADLGEMPSYRLFVQPYLPRRTQSYAAGTFKLRPHPNVVNLKQAEAKQLTWIKSGLPKDAAYRDGFGPVTTLMTMEPWQAPTATRPLAMVLALGSESQWEVEHSPTGSLSHGTLPTLVAVNPRNLVSVVTPPANPRKWKIQVNPATGSYTGSFELLDLTEVRKVSFSGVLRQTPALEDTQIGGGFYLLPALKTAHSNEQTSGAVLFLRPD